MTPENCEQRVIPRWLAVAHSIVSAVVVLMLIAAAVAVVVLLYLGADSRYEQVVHIKDKITNTASGI